MQVAYLKMDHLQDDEGLQYRERPKQCLLSVAVRVSNGREDATVTLTDGFFGNFAKMLKSEKDCVFFFCPPDSHVFTKQLKELNCTMLGCTFVLAWQLQKYGRNYRFY